MATIAENLTALNNTKQAIKTAITAKGVSAENVPFTEYPNLIEQIQAEGGGVINGDIVSCRAAENSNIHQGDFVQFIGNWPAAQLQNFGANNLSIDFIDPNTYIIAIATSNPRGLHVFTIHITDTNEFIIGNSSNIDENSSGGSSYGMQIKYMGNNRAVLTNLENKTIYLVQITEDNIVLLNSYAFKTEETSSSRKTGACALKKLTETRFIVHAIQAFSIFSIENDTISLVVRASTGAYEYPSAFNPTAFAKIAPDVYLGAPMEAATSSGGTTTYTDMIRYVRVTDNEKLSVLNTSDTRQNPKACIEAIPEDGIYWYLTSTPQLQYKRWNGSSSSTETIASKSVSSSASVIICSYRNFIFLGSTSSTTITMYMYDEESNTIISKSINLPSGMSSTYLSGIAISNTQVLIIYKNATTISYAVYDYSPTSFKLATEQPALNFSSIVTNASSRYIPTGIAAKDALPNEVLDVYVPKE